MESVQALQARYERACTLTQEIDEARIVDALTRFMVAHGRDVRVEFVRSEKAAQAARDAQNGLHTWGARDARNARNAWDGWQIAHQQSWAAWVAWSVGHRWQESQDLFYYAITPIGAAKIGEVDTYYKWLPILEAVEAGAYALWDTVDTLYVATRPTVYTEIVDGRVRLHREDGPAYTWYDGQEYYWHGVNVPEYVVMKPEYIEPNEIYAETNIEVQRVMIERYGLERYVHGAMYVIHADRFGTLYGKRTNTSEQIRVVGVTNSTPEPDGTYKQYFLRVPPDVRTAHEAVAWTFSMTPEQYNPVFES